MIQDAVRVSPDGIPLNSLNCDPDPSVSVSVCIFIHSMWTSPSHNQEQNKMLQQHCFCSQVLKKALDFWEVYFLLERTVIFESGFIWWQLFIRNMKADNK